MSKSDAKLITPTSTTPIELPIYEPTLGTKVIDISELGQHGYFTYDPGFLATAACESQITYIDGNAGVLLYRGYPIEELAAKKSYLDVCYLLLNSELPDKKESDKFVLLVKHHTLIHQQMVKFLEGFRRDAHPMAIMVGIVGALSAFYHESMDFNHQEDRYMSAIRLIAKMPTLAAMCYKYSVGHPFMTPLNKMSYAENFLNMMFSLPSEDTPPNKILINAMDKIFILHADHEQNASTSTVRLAGSTGANPFACMRI